MRKNIIDLSYTSFAKENTNKMDVQYYVIELSIAIIH